MGPFPGGPYRPGALESKQGPKRTSGVDGAGEIPREQEPDDLIAHEIKTVLAAASGTDRSGQQH